ncbi:periplasmic component of the Tol biopolymer transport system [Caulobacter sp. AP07]|uniref:PD40 domain-containing protein n=1 Tax=Caulobacter sp. AP07 TaxID=1144304 RepID=UPI0002720BC6|nr:PD40 domain-containing protein [Caulobacter sp. AP07]EJL34752.1 periplasmic component of the Tol biopolymer transport system [Caulobacter sp. AP07]
MKTFARAIAAVVLACGVFATAHHVLADQPAYEIAFASFAPVNSDIFIADADGSHATAFLPDAELDSNASFSSDGQWVLFTSRRAGTSDIYRAHLDGSGLERLVASPAYDDQAALSPDGRSLAFVSSRGGQADIWILDLASKALRNLTHDPAGDFRPSWSPDGRWLAFSSDRVSEHPRIPEGDFTLRHSTEIYIVKVDGTELRRVTRDGQFAGSPTWSPDGSKLAFYAATLPEVRNITAARRLRGVTQIEAVDLGTGASQVLTSGAGEKWSPHWLAPDRIGYVSGGPEGGVEATAGPSGARGEFNSPSWSPDGRHMLFHREVDSTWPPDRRWVSLDPRFGLRRVGIFPSYSPTGDRRVSNDKTAGILHNSVLMMNADGSGASVLFGDAEKSALAPSWSRQGDRIAFGLGQFFQGIKGPAQADIAVIDAQGGGLKLLTKGTGNFGFPDWSGDGRHIVYRQAGAANALDVVDLDSGESHVLLAGPAHYNFPAWSPTADVIAFTADIDGDYEIYSIRADGSGLKRLTRSPGNDAHNAWSPDGKWIAFASARGGFKDEALLHPANPQPYGEIYVMRADGSEAHALTDEPFEKGTPAWAPTGRTAGRR